MFLGPDQILSQGFLPPVIVSTSGKGRENALSSLVQLNALGFLPFSFHWLYLKQPLPSPQAQQTTEPDQCLRVNRHPRHNLFSRYPSPLGSLKP